MHINSLKITNFKGFAEEKNYLPFNTPNGEKGSGLNIFIGENNSGKSTVLEAIDFIRNSTRKDLEAIHHKSACGSFAKEAIVELEFTGAVVKVIDTFAQPNKLDPFKQVIYQCDQGRDYFKISRSTSEIKTLKTWSSANNSFTNTGGLDGTIKKLFETNFIWADTNPSDEAAFGASTLCGTLLKEIASEHAKTEEFIEFEKKFNEVFNSQSSELRQKISVIENKLNSIFSNQFGNASLNFQFDTPKIESFFKGSSILIDDGIPVKMDEKGNGMQRSVALALLQIYAEEVAFDPEKQTSRPFYLFIDEPEICLHPMGQIKLFDALLELATYRQVFVTTHSPYFLNSQYLDKVGIFIFKKENHKNTITKANMDYFFPWSPTWGEINYKAYNLPTVDLHNELYGYLQEKSEKYKEKDFDAWLESQNCPKCKIWIKESKGEILSNTPVTLMTFIRNHIHHPENSSMKSNRYTPDELSQSIGEMIRVLKDNNYFRENAPL